MTINQLLDLPSSELKNLTEEDLKKHFGHLLEVTRPEFVKRVPKKDVDMSPEAIKRRERIAKLEALGIDVSLLKKKQL